MQERGSLNLLLIPLLLQFQTIQYIQPQHHAKLAQAELLVMDTDLALFMY